MKTSLAKLTLENLATKIVVPEFLVNVAAKFGIPPLAVIKWGTWALLPWPIMIGLLAYWGYKGYKTWKTKKELKSDPGENLPSLMKATTIESNESLFEKVDD